VAIAGRFGSMFHGKGFEFTRKFMVDQYGKMWDMKI
jgi:hypothetical protein